MASLLAAGEAANRLHWWGCPAQVMSRTGRLLAKVVPRTSQAGALKNLPTIHLLAEVAAFFTRAMFALKLPRALGVTMVAVAVVVVGV